MLTAFQKYLSEVPAAYDPTEGYVVKKKEKKTGAAAGGNLYGLAAQRQEALATQASLDMAKKVAKKQALTNPSHLTLYVVGGLLVLGAAYYWHVKHR
jgi:hypothetical protein